MVSGSKNTSTVQQTTTQTPSVPSFFQNPTMAAAGRIEALGGVDPSAFLTPATANQNAAFSGARGLLDFQPQSVSAGQISSTNLSPYMNPFTQNVIDTSLNDLDRARRIAINGNSGQAVAAGGSNAWMSDRAGVADAETNRGFLDQAGALSANLRSAGFQNAQQAAQFDINNRLGADQFNATQALAANQNQRANLGFLSDLGAQERAIASENNPNVAAITKEQALAQLLAALNPGLYTGQTANTNGTTTQRNTPGLLDIAGTIAQGVGAFTGNPFLMMGGSAVKGA